MTMYALTPTGVTTVEQPSEVPAQAALGHHVVTEDGTYILRPRITHPLWQDPLLARLDPPTKANWWGRFSTRKD